MERHCPPCLAPSPCQKAPSPLMGAKCPLQRPLPSFPKVPSLRTPGSRPHTQCSLPPHPCQPSLLPNCLSPHDLALSIQPMLCVSLGQQRLHQQHPALSWPWLLLCRDPREEVLRALFLTGGKPDWIINHGSAISGESTPADPCTNIIAFNPCSNPQREVLFTQEESEAQRG